MRSKLLHLCWIVPLVLIATLAVILMHIQDKIRFGNASPLHRAVIHGDQQRVSQLIAQGVNLNVSMYASHFVESYEATPLHMAAFGDRIEIVNMLIRAGADKESKDYFGFTPLHRALHSSSDGAAQGLIRAGAKINYEPDYLSSNQYVQFFGQPIVDALENASIHTVQLMLDAGADLRSDIGENAMEFVNGPDRLAKLRLLVERGFSVEAASKGLRPLHRAALANDTESITFLLDHGANIDALDVTKTDTPLVTAAYHGSNEAVKLLIDRGANPNAGTEEFGSPIFAAAFNGNRETVRLLLSMNLNIDLQLGRDSDQVTPLHMAYWHEDQELIDLLLKAGAHPGARTYDGKKPFEYRKLSSRRR